MTWTRKYQLTAETLRGRLDASYSRLLSRWTSQVPCYFGLDLKFETSIPGGGVKIKMAFYSKYGHPLFANVIHWCAVCNEMHRCSVSCSWKFFLLLYLNRAWSVGIMRNELLWFANGEACYALKCILFRTPWFWFVSFCLVKTSSSSDNTAVSGEAPGVLVLPSRRGLLFFHSLILPSRRASAPRLRGFNQTAAMNFLC